MLHSSGRNHRNPVGVHVSYRAVLGGWAFHPYVSSVATFHRAAAVANPCEALTVKLALKRMHRERGRAQAQAAPLNDVRVNAGEKMHRRAGVDLLWAFQCGDKDFNRLVLHGFIEPSPSGLQRVA